MVLPVGMDDGLFAFVLAAVTAFFGPPSGTAVGALSTSIWANVGTADTALGCAEAGGSAAVVTGAATGPVSALAPFEHTADCGAEAGVLKAGSTRPAACDAPSSDNATEDEAAAVRSLAIISSPKIGSTSAVEPGRAGSAPWALVCAVAAAASLGFICAAERASASPAAGFATFSRLGAVELVAKAAGAEADSEGPASWALACAVAAAASFGIICAAERTSVSPVADCAAKAAEPGANAEGGTVGTKPWAAFGAATAAAESVVPSPVDPDGATTTGSAPPAADTPRSEGDKVGAFGTGAGGANSAAKTAAISSVNTVFAASLPWRSESAPDPPPADFSSAIRGPVSPTGCPELESSNEANDESADSPAGAAVSERSEPGVCVAAGGEKKATCMWYLEQSRRLGTQRSGLRSPRWFCPP